MSFDWDVNWSNQCNTTIKQIFPQISRIMSRHDFFHRDNYYLQNCFVDYYWNYFFSPFLTDISLTCNIIYENNISSSVLVKLWFSISHDVINLLYWYLNEWCLYVWVREKINSMKMQFSPYFHSFSIQTISIFVI